MKSQYELLREEKIARNELRLAELGLLRNTQTSSTTRKRPMKDESNNNETNSQKSQKVSSSSTPQSSSDIIPLRRSSRRRNQDVRYKFEDEPIQKNKSTKRSLQDYTSALQNDPTSALQIEKQNKKMSYPKELRKPSTSFSSAPTARTTDIHVGKIIKQYLGKQLEETGKAFVVNTAVECSLSKSEDDNSSTSMTMSTNIGFNKMSGVLEWKNDSYFLWINIDGKPNDVGLYNEFLGGGMQITWFGGSRMHDETPVIQKLIARGKKANNKPKKEPDDTGSNFDTSDGIILFCRLLDDKKRALPYVCLGRLGYHSHIPGSRPLQFVWSLLDYEQLAIKSDLTHEKGDVVSYFQQIVNF